MRNTFATYDDLWHLCIDVQHPMCKLTKERRKSYSSRDNEAIRGGLEGRRVRPERHATDLQGRRSSTMYNGQKFVWGVGAEKRNKNQNSGQCFLCLACIMQTHLHLPQCSKSSFISPFMHASTQWHSVQDETQHTTEVHQHGSVGSSHTGSHIIFGLAAGPPEDP